MISELEEGEASYYQNGDETTIDPDVSFSYIDVKIQDFLGHFQKDFEGGVSAEHLGAKFGGYGSFLPTYARSSACSQERTTAEVIDWNTPKSPRILDHEVSHLSSIASSCSSLPLRLGARSTASPKRNGSISGRVKGDGRVPLNSVDTPTSNGEQKSEFPYDQRTLKVRLRVGSNNLPDRKNAEIYSGLGLDDSPSPSLNDSYTDTEWLPHDIRDPSGNSPTSILKTMTSFLLQGAQLLSPLSEELICFTEKEKYSRQSVSKLLHKGKVNGHESRKDVREPLPEKKTDSYENSDFQEAGEHRNVGLFLKRETEKEQSSEPKSVQEIGRVQKSKGNIAPSSNISILEKENLFDNCTVTKTPSRHKGQINIVSAKVESGLPERETAPNAELFDSRETKSMQASASIVEVIGNEAHVEDQLCAMGGNKLEGAQTRDSRKSFAPHERNNGSHVNSVLPKNGFLATRNDPKKITNKYQEFFGDLDYEQDDNKVSSKDVSSVKKLMDSNGSTLEDIRITKEKSSVRKAGELYKAEEYPRSSSLAEKHANKPHKKSSLDSYYVGGDAKKIKTRKKRQSDSDSSRSSKKVKPQDVLYNDENCMTAVAVNLVESGICLENSPPSQMPLKDKRTIDGHLKDVKDEFTNHITATEITYDTLLPNHKRDDKSSSQKKKGQGEQGTRSYGGDLPRIGHQSRCNSEDNERKVKKARTSNSEGKVAITRKSIDQQIKQERGSCGTADSLKMDLGTVHPSVVPRSSSSPVESVSSSPSRVLRTDKRVLASINLQEKEDRDGTFVDNCSPRGYLGGPTNKVIHSAFVESYVVDPRDKDLGFVSGSKIQEENRSSSDFATQPINNVDSKGNQDTCENQDSERYQDERKDNRTFDGGSHSVKLENGTSLHHGNCTFTSENNNDHFTSPDSKKGVLDDSLLSNGKLTGGRSRFQESCVSFDKDEKDFISGKSSSLKEFSAISDRENKSTPGCNDGLDVKLNMKESIELHHDVQDASNKLLSDIRSGSVISGSVKSSPLPPSVRLKNDKGSHLPLISRPPKENAVDNAYGDTSKAPEQNKKGEKHNGSTPSRHSNTTMDKARDHDGSAVRKDSRSQAAANAMREAKDLKRLADRLKNSGSADSTGMYFEAALKFLYGASLLESGNRENNKHNDIQCIDMYRSTAKFCEFCAHEFERSKDMVSAALAYKCMEVSYMRVIYTSNGNANRDRNEVQMALQIVPPGESPASSASDVDNLNNPVTVDKVSTSKGMTSVQVAGNTGITAKNRSSFTRLLEFAQDVSAAMDATRKSRAAFTAANLRSGDANCGDGISSVKRALEFNFQDVDGLLRLIRIAKDAIGR